MAEQQENTAAETNSQVERQHACTGIERGQGVVADDRTPDVIRDEEEALRRAKLPKVDDDPPEAKNPQIAEIESIVAAFRH